MAAIRGCNSVVESHLPMVNVVGSSPITRFGCKALLSRDFENFSIVELAFMSL
jgi:hypothetical protein